MTYSMYHFLEYLKWQICNILNQICLYKKEEIKKLFCDANTVWLSFTIGNNGILFISQLWITGIVTLCILDIFYHNNNLLCFFQRQKGKIWRFDIFPFPYWSLRDLLLEIFGSLITLIAAEILKREKCKLLYMGYRIIASLINWKHLC